MSNDIVQVQITVESVGLTARGYGIPLIVTHKADVTPRVSTYASPAEVGEDYEDDSPEKLYADALFAQSPRPSSIMIGRADGAVPTLEYTLDASSPASSHLHTLLVKGEGFDDASVTYTSGASATAEQIHSGLLTALNAVADKNYLAEFAALVYADKTFTAANTDIVTVATHGLSTGDGPFRLTTDMADLPAGLATGTDYWIIKLDANTFKFASTLANAIAATPIPVDITDAGTGTHTMSDTADTKRPSDPFTITGATAGDWFSIELAREDIRNEYLTSAMTHASPSGLSTELDAILLDDASFYQIHTLFPSAAMITVFADWAELNERGFVFASSDTDILNVAVGSGTDIGVVALGEGYTYTSGVYWPAPNKFAAGRWMGRWLPTLPGKATAKFKNLVGMGTPMSLTGTQKNNLKNRRMQTYVTEYGQGMMNGGMVFSTTYKYIDVRRNVDKLTDDVRRMISGLLIGSDIIPYTPAGISKIEGGLRGALSLNEDAGILTEGYTTVEVPVFDDIDPADKADRNLRNLTFTGLLQGAIESVIPVLGNVTF